MVVFLLRCPIPMHVLLHVWHVFGLALIVSRVYWATITGCTFFWKRDFIDLRQLHQDDTII